jgi:alanine racemase
MSIRSKANQLLDTLEHQFETFNTIEISKSALLNNFDFYAHLSGLPVIPVLKSNAYGHGIKQVAQALASRTMPYLAVDGYFEALRIREVTAQAVLVMGAIAPANFKTIGLDNFSFVVQDAVTIEALGRRAAKVKIHLEINTGMNRYGVDCADVLKFVKIIGKYPNLEFEGVMTHLADSDGLDPRTIDQAVKLFDEAIDLILASGARPTMFHIAQSAGTPKVHSRHASAVRVGIGLYGINPLDLRDPLFAKLDSLRPALTLSSTITQIHELQKGDKVSYNYTFEAQAPLRMGVMPIGYYEGLPRALSNAGIVTVNTHPAPIIGRVCMNHAMISLEGTSAQIGDRIEIISNHPDDPNSIQNIARDHDLFNYQLLTSLSNDIRRQLVD